MNFTKPKDYILNRLREAAALSEDPDTQIACLAVKTTNADGIPVIMSQAANRMARNVERRPDRLVRPDKYNWIMHAEWILISDAARSGIPTNGNIILCNWFPCAPCASMIVQAGFAELAGDRGRFETRKDDPRYGFAIAESILREGGVKVSWLDEWQP